jgi:hypothetical protein
MPGFWIRVDATVNSHPKSIKAGWWGVKAAEDLWKICKLHGKRGVLSPDFCTPEYITDFTRGGPDQVSGYRAGLLSAEESGFIDRLPDGSVSLHNWSEYQWDEGAAERQRRHRDRVRQRDVTCDVTPSHDVTPVTTTPTPTPTPTPTEKGTGTKPSAVAPGLELVGQRREAEQKSVPASVQTAAGRKPESKPVKHITPQTPKDGLDDVDLSRRAFAVCWKQTERHNGAQYPDQPEKDRKAAGSLLGYHRRNKIEQPWKEWMTQVFVTYLSDNDPFLTDNGHPLCLLPSRLPAVVAKMAKEYSQ